MRLIISIFSIFFVQAQDPSERIECYSCEYRISDRGDESGAYCLSVTENTPKKTYELNKVHNHHGPGVNTKSRTDCAVIQGEGTETLIEDGKQVTYNFKYLARHDWDNYEDTATFDYSGGSLSGINYREKTHECGAEVTSCAQGVYFPIRTRRSLQVEPMESSQTCPACQLEQYFSLNTNNWALTKGHEGCDSSPQSSIGVNQKECMGLCVVAQEEYMFNGADYKKATYRWCQNGTSSSDRPKHPKWDITFNINTQNTRLCTGNLCNDDSWGASSALPPALNFSMLIFSCLFALVRGLY